MDEGPVTDTPAAATAAPRRGRSWKLAPAVASKTHGLVVSGFGSLGTGRALFIDLAATSGSLWLNSLLAVAPVTAADGDRSQERAAAIAFSWTGLKRMGLADTALASFARPFREGMMQEDRLRRLGDRRGGKWLETVVEEGPRWSANTPVLETGEDGGAAEKQIPTPLTVHVVLLLYAADEDAANLWCRQVDEALAPHGVAVVHHLPLVLDPNDIGVSSEHFGFADGLSQPAPYDAAPDADRRAVTIGGEPASQDPIHGVPLGEFLFGYANGHQEEAPGPVVAGDDDPRPVEAGLMPHRLAEGYFDLGLNGSYLVVRQLKQDVAAFWNSMHENADRIREQDPEHAEHVTAEWIAERVVGRNRKGHLLCTPPGSFRDADPGGVPDNQFRFSEGDPYGVGCPAGSHVRRANPRDALAPINVDRSGFLDPSKTKESSRRGMLKAANNHRILRRGRKYGPKIQDERVDDGHARGLLFMCLNTDIERQFEFVQQTWLLNSNFATLLDETDPLVGPAGRMTIKEEPLRRTVNVETFVKMAGGDYFFLPSMPALRYLAML